MPCWRCDPTPTRIMCGTLSFCSNNRPSNVSQKASPVAAPSLTENELRFLRALLRRKVRFVVVGLSAAALQGAPVVTQDVDLWFEDLSDPRIGEALREVDAAYVPPSILNPPMFASQHLFATWESAALADRYRLYRQ